MDSLNKFLVPRYSCLQASIQSGKPIEEVAAKYGTNELFVSNPTLIFILLGGFITNFIYCAWLNIKNGSYKDYAGVSGGVFLNNIAFTFMAGLLWFLQFHFYGMGKSQIPVQQNQH